jgi:RHH-type proline utilization regulon transcriptional repressor/proline dehydrogenase/delta 1-pyrroline-5-carboxylate dehydrogenase
MVRLVKGAYWDAEIKRAQVDGLPGYPVYTRKVYTDISYLACAKRLLAAQDAIYPQFATHNAYSLSAIYQLGQGLDYEFQCLHGMGETLYDQVVGKDNLGKACRIYAPVGSHETLLAYLVRRLLENGANSSFVNRIVDENVSIDELVTDQVAEAASHAGQPHHKIALPVSLYGSERQNSKGLDLSSEHVLAALQIGLQGSEQQQWTAFPLLGDADISEGDKLPVRNPADHADIVGEVIEATPEHVERALQLAEAAAARWANTPVADRAAA